MEYKHTSSKTSIIDATQIILKNIISGQNLDIGVNNA